MARKNNKREKLKTFILYIIAGLILAVFMAIPLGVVSYMWVLYAIKQAPLWLSIIVTALMAFAEGLIVIIETGGDE